MTSGQVEQAVQTLERDGKAPSARNVNRLLRRTPPRYMGASFRELLPLLQHQHDTPDDPCYTQVIEMAQSLEDALTHRRVGQLPALIQQGEATWSRCAPAMHQASARRDPMPQIEQWAAAFERLRLACSAAIIQVYGRRYG